MTIERLVMGECGLSHEQVEDGRKSACLKLGGLKTLGVIW